MQNATQTTKPSVFLFGASIDQGAVHNFAISLETWSNNNPGRPLRIDINSQGGNILDGLSLLGELRRFRRAGHHLTIAVYGRAASVAGWVLQAADVRIIDSESWILIHEVASRTEGSLSVMKREIARCEALQNQTFGLLMSRSKLTRERLDQETVNAVDWWVSAAEAKELGLVDIVEDAPVYAPVAVV